MDIFPLIPESWKAALSEIRYYAPDAVLAGGALRDLAMGGAVKDLDVFTSVRHHNLLTSELMKPGRRWNYGKEMVCGGYFVAMQTEVQFVQEWTFSGLPHVVNLIYLQLDDPETDLETWARNRVDWDACQVSFDGRRVMSSEGFLRAVERRKFTLTRADTLEQLHRSGQRALRFAEKYPDVTFDWSLRDELFPGYAVQAA